MNIYIPHTKGYQSIQTESDIIKHSEYLNSVDEVILPFLLNWMSDSEKILVQTSGSTGNPSTIELEKSAMRVSAELTLKRFNLKPEALIVNCLPIKFIAGKMMLVRAIVGNLNLHLVKPSNDPIKDFPDNTIQFTALTPPQLESGITNADKALNHIETIIIGGAPISTSLQTKILTMPAHCYATYGMTETITHVAIQSLNKPFEESFKALKGIRLTTIDGALEIAANHLKESPILTTDMVDLSKCKTTFKWLGRKDFVINSGGVKLFPEKIERQIQSFLSHRIIISGQADNTYGTVPILIIESNRELDFSIAKLNLDKMEMPKKIYYVDRFIETENGKINRLETAKLIDKPI